MNELELSKRPLERAELARFKKLERTIEKGLKTFYEVGRALEEIRDTRLYRDSHVSFEAYCRDKWGMSKTHVNRQILAAQAVDTLEAAGEKMLDVKEAYVRPITKLPVERQREAWNMAVERHGGADKLTRIGVDEVVKELMAEGKMEIIQKTPAAPPTPYQTKFVNQTRLVQGLRDFCKYHHIKMPKEVFDYIKRFR